MDAVRVILSLAVGLGLLNVWLVRSKTQTAFRGARAPSLKKEFIEYGLPEWAFYAVGTLKVGAALGLLASLAFPAFAVPSALIIAVLMVGALLMHWNVKDSLQRFVPAAAVLLLSVAILFL